MIDRKLLRWKKRLETPRDFPFRPTKEERRRAKEEGVVIAFLQEVEEFNHYSRWQRERMVSTSGDLLKFSGALNAQFWLMQNDESVYFDEEGFVLSENQVQPLHKRFFKCSLYEVVNWPPEIDTRVSLRKSNKPGVLWNARVLGRHYVPFRYTFRDGSWYADDDVAYCNGALFFLKESNQ